MTSSSDLCIPNFSMVHSQMTSVSVPLPCNSSLVNGKRFGLCPLPHHPSLVHGQEFRPLSPSSSPQPRPWSGDSASAPFLITPTSSMASDSASVPFLITPASSMVSRFGLCPLPHHPSLVHGQVIRPLPASHHPSLVHGQEFRPLSPSSSSQPRLESVDLGLFFTPPAFLSSVSILCLYSSLHFSLCHAPVLSTQEASLNIYNMKIFSFCVKIFIFCSSLSGHPLNSCCLKFPNVFFMFF
jgi:hypothetical protein